MEGSGMGAAELLSILNSQKDGWGSGNGVGFLFLFLLLLFGVGNGGWGRGFGNFGGAAGTLGYDTSSLNDIKQTLSTMQITDGSAWSALQNKLFDLSRQGDTNTASLMRALSDCCCQTQRAIDGTNFNISNVACDIRGAINNSYNATAQTLNNMRYENQNGFNALANQAGADTCKILQAITDGTNNTINYMKCQEIQSLRTDLQSAQGLIAQNNQTQQILTAINALKPTTTTTPAA